MYFLPLKSNYIYNGIIYTIKDSLSMAALMMIFLHWRCILHYFFLSSKVVVFSMNPCKYHAEGLIFSPKSSWCFFINLIKTCLHPVFSVTLRLKQEASEISNYFRWCAILQQPGIQNITMYKITANMLYRFWREFFPTIFVLDF